MEGARQSEGWLQRLIACALSIGIGKRALFEDYYFDELSPLIEAYCALRGAAGGADECADPLAFMGEGGEWAR